MLAKKRHLVSTHIIVETRCLNFSKNNKKPFWRASTERSDEQYYGNQPYFEDNQSSIEVMKTLIPTVLYIYYTNIVNWYI